MCFVFELDFALIFSFLANSKAPAVPVCSQLSMERRWEMVQWSCNIQLQRSVEKSDAKSSDTSPRWPMRETIGLGR